MHQSASVQRADQHPFLELVPSLEGSVLVLSKWGMILGPVAHECHEQLIKIDFAQNICVRCRGKFQQDRYLSNQMVNCLLESLRQQQAEAALSPSSDCRGGA